MGEHRVVFHIGTGTVVCSCGDYFCADRRSYGLPPEDAVSKWARHLKESTPHCCHSHDERDDE